MTRQELIRLILDKRSFLCIGLDPLPESLPSSLQGEPADRVFEFNRRIIDATIDLAVAYKPNMAFYEALGSKGWESLEKTIQYLSVHPGGPVFTIADAKRADIGHSSTRYAKAFFEAMPFDALTVNPYLGRDSIMPFLSFPGKWAVVLALTSNYGALDFQMLHPSLPGPAEKSHNKTTHCQKLFEVVMEQCVQWGSPGQLMFVVGATQAAMLGQLRELVPEHFFLIPGVGAQGGSLREVAEVTMNAQVGILVNSSRNIIYAGSDDDFDTKAREAASALQSEMETILRERRFIS